MGPEKRLVELRERECQLDLKKLERIATPLTHFSLEWQLPGSVQKH